GGSGLVFSGFRNTVVHASRTSPPLLQSATLPAISPERFEAGNIRGVWALSAASAPVIGTLSPNPARHSGIIKITGTGFGTKDASQLLIDGKQSPFIARWSDTFILAHVPEDATIGNVTVSITTDAGTATGTIAVTGRNADGR